MMIKKINVKMMNNKAYLFSALILSAIVILMNGCKGDGLLHDASGSFEADEIIIAAEAMGTVVTLDLQEGEKVKKGQQLGVIDSIQLLLQKDQIQASVEAVRLKQNEAEPQLAVIRKQITTAKNELEAAYSQQATLAKEQARIHKLFQGAAATQQQKDDIDGKAEVMQKQLTTINSKIDVLKAQYESTAAAVRIQNRGLLSEVKPLEKKGEILKDQLLRTRILAPSNGVVLTQYVREGEWVSPGKAVCKIANLDEMTLRAYISGDQLPKVKLGQKVSVFIESGDGKEKTYSGTLSWIADKAEFTPKTIQTRDERTQLVYAVKIKVKNDGWIKIGMYGEVDLDPKS